MKPNGFVSKAFHLYYDGFRQMTLGKTLWLVIVVKLFIIFAILKLFFFPDYISQQAAGGDKAEFVAERVLDMPD